jgi:acyl-CoA dehydrogenase
MNMAAGRRQPWTERASWLDADLVELARLARNFFAKEVQPYRDRFAKQGFPDREVYRKAGELGLLCLSIPEAYGGGGGTFAHEAVVLTEQVFGEAEALPLGVVSGIVPHYLLSYGSEEQKQRWLPKLASGELVAAIAMTEPGTGSDLQSIGTRAIREGDDYIVSGAKTFITNGHNCDLVVIAVKTDPSARAAGLSLIVAEVTDDTPGFSRGRVIEKIGQKGQDTAELFFDELLIPVANLLGPREGQGFSQLMSQLAYERLICAVVAVAATELAVEETIEYAKQRTAFGKVLFDFQNTKFELAECATIARIARSFLDDCIERHLRGELDVTTAAMAKYWLTDQQCAVIDRCLQLFGGYGYTLEYRIARLYADARVQRIYAGSNEIMKELISRSL